MDEQPPSESARAQSASPYILPASILVAALLVSGSIVYLVKSGSSTDSGQGAAKKWPKTVFTECVESKQYAPQVKADYAAAQEAGVGGPPTVFVSGNKVLDWTKDLPKAIEDALSGKVKPNPDPLFAVKERDVILGDPAAPVMIIEYGDYQCPYCAGFFTDIEPMLRTNYIETGKAKMVFRNFQFLSQESIDTAEAAECAKDQGKFWEFHDKIYEAEGKDGVEHNKNLNKDLFLQIATDIGLMEKK